MIDSKILSFFLRKKLFAAVVFGGALVIIFVSFGQSAGAEQDFELLGEHPVAGSEVERNIETSLERVRRMDENRIPEYLKMFFGSIRDIFPWKGKMYLSYRSFSRGLHKDASWDPFVVFSYDPKKEAFVEEFKWLGSLATPFRTIDGVLYATAETSMHNDALGHKVVSYAELKNGVWSIRLSEDVARDNFTAHTYDIGKTTGNLWLAVQGILMNEDGTYKNQFACVIYRSTDRGDTWQRSLDIPARPESIAKGGTYSDLSRCHFVGTLNNKVYVQAVDYLNGIHPTSMVFDGTQWQTGPNLFAPYEADAKGVTGYAPEIFAGRMVYLARTQPDMRSLGGHTLFAFDGEKVTQPVSDAVDFFVSGDTLYLLASTTIRSTKDLKTWETVTTNIPDTALSIAVMDDRIYLGATDAKLYRSTFTLSSKEKSVTCNLYSAGTVPPAGFGAAWDTRSTAKALLLTSSCTASEARLEIKSGAEGGMVHDTGYEYVDNAWKPITFNGSQNKDKGAWLMGGGSVTLSRTRAQMTATNFWIGFTCQPYESIWKCGCRDEACVTPHWQLQAFKR